MGNTCAKPIVGALSDGAVAIRCITEHDIETIRLWRARDDVRIWFRDKAVIDPAAQRAWFAKYLSKHDDVMFIIELDETPIGTIALYDIDRTRRLAEYGRIMIGVPSARGRGIGKIASRLLCRWAFEQLDVSQIVLWVVEDNHRAISLYEDLGFRIATPEEPRAGYIQMTLSAGDFSRLPSPD